MVPFPEFLSSRFALLGRVEGRCFCQAMVTIATFSKPEEAHLLRMRLEDAGISAYLRDENTIQWEWASNAFGGVRVDVADEDVAAAKVVLNMAPQTGE